MFEPRLMIGIDPAEKLGITLVEERNGKYGLLYARMVRCYGGAMGADLNGLYINLQREFEIIRDFGKISGILVEHTVGYLPGRQTATLQVLTKYTAIVQLVAFQMMSTVPLELIHPKKWQCPTFSVRVGMKGINSKWLKAASLKLANLRFERGDGSPWIEIKDDNIADAANIAAYGFAHFPREVAP